MLRPVLVQPEESGVVMRPARIADGLERPHMREGEVQAQKGHPGAEHIQPGVTQLIGEGAVWRTNLKGLALPCSGLGGQRGGEGVHREDPSLPHRGGVRVVQHGLHIFVQIHGGHGEPAAYLCQPGRLEGVRIILQRENEKTAVSCGGDLGLV